MRRLRLSPTRRLTHFLAAGGRCAACGWRIQAGQRWELDHIVPLAEGGADSEDNLQVLCRACHAGKTVAEVTRSARAQRQRLRHLGAWRARSSLPGSRGSGWKRHLDGTVTRRDKDRR